ncbi:MAG: TetR/AcrR family transcriptional regulator [Xanthobacteraceae bacterium]
MPAPATKMTKKSDRTKDRILGAAERLFSEHGYDGVSMRQIGAAAKAQIALISYYFGTKERLYRAVFKRRLDPVSRQRLDALHQVLTRTAPPATIEDVLDALARPWVELRDSPEGRNYTRLIAREVNDPRERHRGIVEEMLDPIAREFIAAMERVLPDHSLADVHWAYHFFIGALLLVMVNPERTRRLSGSFFDLDGRKDVVGEIVRFVARALQGSEPKKKTGRHKTLHNQKGRLSHEARNVRSA